MKSARETGLAGFFKRSFTNDVCNCNYFFDAPDRLFPRIHRGSDPPAPSQALKSADCSEIHEERVSGGNRARAGMRKTDDRLPAIIGAIKGVNPDIPLQAT